MNEKITTDVHTLRDGRLILYLQMNVNKILYFIDSNQSNVIIFQAPYRKGTTLRHWRHVNELVSLTCTSVISLLGTHRSSTCNFFNWTTPPFRELLELWLKFWNFSKVFVSVEHRCRSNRQLTILNYILGTPGLILKILQNFHPNFTLTVKH